MHRSNRLFEVIQILRAAKQPVTAEQLAGMLEVSPRTVYRDVAALQAMRVPVEGEAGVGYLMRRGYDLPPLNFDEEEIQALQVGLLLLSRTGDSALQRAAQRIKTKIDALQQPADWLQVNPWGAPMDDPALGCVSRAMLRSAIREERKLRLTYRKIDEEEETLRIVRPVALVYHTETVVLAGWCELRKGFRHFRCDRIYACHPLEERFSGQGATLRGLWLEENRWNDEAC